MNCFTLRLATVLMPWVLGSLLITATRAQEKPTPRQPSGTVGEVLLRAGYAKVPLASPTKPLVLIEVEIGGKPFRFLLDTGASRTVVCAPSMKAARINLPITDEKATVAWGIDGKNTTGKLVQVDALVLRGVKSAPFQAFLLDKPLTCDNSDLANPKNCDGVLGGDLLDYFAAVVDYGDLALYIIDPVERESGLQGEWSCGSLVIEGLPQKEETLKLWGLNILGKRVDFRAAEHFRNLKLTLSSLSVSPRQMKWPIDEKAGFHWIYKLEQDTLTLCGQVTGEKVLSMPTEFKSTKENGYIVITFKRVVAEKPKK